MGIYKDSQDTKGNTRKKKSPANPKTDKDSQAVVYFEKDIKNPKETIVQQQVKGEQAKMLVHMPNNEQRLITFKIPIVNCTVQDLLDQAKISITSKTNISLVKDPAHEINYVVHLDATRQDAFESSSAKSNIQTQSCGSSASKKSLDCEDTVRTEPKETIATKTTEAVTNDTAEESICEKESTSIQDSKNSLDYKDTITTEPADTITAKTTVTVTTDTAEESICEKETTSIQDSKNSLDCKDTVTTKPTDTVTAKTTDTVTTDTTEESIYEKESTSIQDSSDIIMDSESCKTAESTDSTGNVNTDKPISEVTATLNKSSTNAAEKQEICNSTSSSKLVNNNGSQSNIAHVSQEESAVIPDSDNNQKQPESEKTLDSVALDRIDVAKLEEVNVSKETSTIVGNGVKTELNIHEHSVNSNENTANLEKEPECCGVQVSVKSSSADAAVLEISANIEETMENSNSSVCSEPISNTDAAKPITEESTKLTEASDSKASLNSEDIAVHTLAQNGDAISTAENTEEMETYKALNTSDPIVEANDNFKSENELKKEIVSDNKESENMCPLEPIDTFTATDITDDNEPNLIKKIPQNASSEPKNDSSTTKDMERDIIYNIIKDCETATSSEPIDEIATTDENIVAKAPASDTTETSDSCDTPASKKLKTS